MSRRRISTARILIPIMMVGVLGAIVLDKKPGSSPVTVAHAAAPALPDAGQYTVISRRGGYAVESATEVCYKGTTYVIFNAYNSGAVASVEFIDGHTVSCK